MTTFSLRTSVAALLAVLGSMPLAARADLISGEPSLVGYWQLNEASGSTTVTDSASGYHGSVVGNPALGAPSAMPRLGSAVVFNGSASNRLSVPYQAKLNPSTFTVEAFARVGAATDWNPVANSRGGANGSTVNEGYVFYATLPQGVPFPGPAWEFWTGIGGVTSTTFHRLPGPSVIQNQWVHLAGSYETAAGADHKVFYMNGQPVNSYSGTTRYLPQTGSPLVIGSGGATGENFGFDGAIDNVAVFNAALEHQTIADHYNSFSGTAQAMKRSAPVAHWRLGEQMGTSAYNSVDVTEHRGTYQGVTLRQMDIGLTDDIDTATDFNGSTSRLTVPFSTELNPLGSFSVEVWAKPEGGAGSSRSLVSSRHTDGVTGTEGFVLFASDENQWEFWTGTGDSFLQQTEGGAITLNEWTHIVGVFEATGIDGNGVFTGIKSIYINGKLVTQITDGLYRPNSVGDMWIGYGGVSTPAFFFNGLLDEIAIYNYALTASQVRSHFSAQPIPEPGTIALLGCGALGLLAYSLRRGRRA